MYKRFKQHTKMITFLSSVLFIGLSQTANAGIQSDLGKFLDNSSFSNFTGPQVAHTQEGGYYSGGSGYIRTPVQELQLANIQLPSISAGCGNIDIFTGAFSFIDGDQLINFGKKVMQDAPTFAVELALQTWAPSVASKLETLQKWVQDINSASMSSCQAAELGVGAIAGAFENSAGKQFLCQSYAAQNNKYADWLSGEQKCSDDSTADDMNKKAKSDPKIKDLVKADRNIVWYVLQKNAFLKDDPEVAELLMSITGTIIYGDSLTDKRTYVSMLNDKSDMLIKNLLYGGKVNIYKCKDGKSAEKCLIISKAGDADYSPVDIQKSSSLVTVIQKDLESIGNKFLSGAKTTDIDDNITASTPFPVLKFITVNLEAGQEPPYAKYADILAREILTTYLTNLESIVKQSLAAKANSGDDEDFKTIIKNIALAQNVISSIKTDAYQSINNSMQLVTNTMKIEQMVVGYMSSQSKQNVSYMQ